MTAANRRPDVQKLASIALLILDVDGVMTDGRLHYDAEGREGKVFHVHDGHGIKQIMQNGIEVAVISGRESAAVKARLAELGITHVYLGQDTKQQAFENLLAKLSLTPAAVACVGDDEPDLPLITAAGLGITVANAHETVLAAADWCTERSGGQGAVREICDALLAARNKDR